MIDIGANLSNEQFNGDLDAVMSRAITNKVNAIILTTTNLQTYHKNKTIIEKYHSDIYLTTTYGLHPHYASNHKPIFEEIKNALSDKDVVAIGELGLDYFRNLSDQKTQQYVMEQFLEYAKDFPHLPLFLHERDAFNDFSSILKNAQTSNKAVVHCFTGNKEQAKTYIDNGWYIGITGWISDKKRNSELTEALKYIPLSKLMIETDAPYLTPKNMPVSMRRNEPAFLEYVAKSIAEIKHISIEEVLYCCTQNTVDFFNFSGYNNNYKTIKNK